MVDRQVLSGRKVTLLSAIALSSGIIGMLIGKVIGAALHTSPAWVGPAMFIGSIALVLVGFLLLPGAIREYRANRGPSA